MPRGRDLSGAAGVLELEKLVAVIGTTADTAVVAGAVGTQSAKLRRLTTDLAAVKTSAAIMDDWDETNRAAVNLIASQIGVDANAGDMSAKTLRMTIATNDTHFGAVGVAASVSGVVHAQLRYIGDAVNNIPAQGQALEAASVPCVLTAAQETALKAVVEASAANSLTALQLIDNTVGTHDDTVSTAILAVGSKAETTTPDAVADGDDVRIWTDEYGAVVIKGFDTATGTLSIREQDPAILRTVESRLLNAVTANTTSDAVTVEGLKNWGVEWLTASSTEAVITIWVKITSLSSWMSYKVVTLTGTDEHTNWAVSDHVYAVRVVVTGYVAGTISAYLRAGV